MASYSTGRLPPEPQTDQQKYTNIVWVRANMPRTDTGKIALVSESGTRIQRTPEQVVALYKEHPARIKTWRPITQTELSAIEAKSAAKALKARQAVEKRREQRKKASAQAIAVQKAEFWAEQAQKSPVEKVVNYEKLSPLAKRKVGAAQQMFAAKQQTAVKLKADTAKGIKRAGVSMVEFEAVGGRLGAAGKTISQVQRGAIKITDKASKGVDMQYAMVGGALASKKTADIIVKEQRREAITKASGGTMAEQLATIEKMEKKAAKDAKAGIIRKDVTLGQFAAAGGRLGATGRTLAAVERGTLKLPSSDIVSIGGAVATEKTADVLMSHYKKQERLYQAAQLEERVELERMAAAKAVSKVTMPVATTIAGWAPKIRGKITALEKERRELGGFKKRGIKMLSPFSPEFKQVGLAVASIPTGLAETVMYQKAATWKGFEQLVQHPVKTTPKMWTGIKEEFKAQPIAAATTWATMLVPLGVGAVSGVRTVSKASKVVKVSRASRLIPHTSGVPRAGKVTFDIKTVTKAKTVGGKFSAGRAGQLPTKSLTTRPISTMRWDETGLFGKKIPTKLVTTAKDTTIKVQRWTRAGKEYLVKTTQRKGAKTATVTRTVTKAGKQISKKTETIKAIGPASREIYFQPKGVKGVAEEYYKLKRLGRGEVLEKSAMVEQLRPVHISKVVKGKPPVEVYGRATRASRAAKHTRVGETITLRSERAGEAIIRGGKETFRQIGGERPRGMAVAATRLEIAKSGRPTTEFLKTKHGKWKTVGKPLVDIDKGTAFTAMKRGRVEIRRPRPVSELGTERVMTGEIYIGRQQIAAARRVGISTKQRKTLGIDIQKQTKQLISKEKKLTAAASRRQQLQQLESKQKARTTAKVKVQRLKQQPKGKTKISLPERMFRQRLSAKPFTLLGLGAAVGVSAFRPQKLRVVGAPFKLISTQPFRMATRARTQPLTTIKQTPIVAVKPIVKPITTAKTKAAIRAKQVTVVPVTPIPVPVTPIQPVTPSPIIIGGIDDVIVMPPPLIIVPKIGERYRKKKKITKPTPSKKKYLPSVVAKFFQIYGKRPTGKLTGLEFRPMVK